MHTVPSGEDCWICGDELMVHTEAKQVCDCGTDGTNCPAHNFDFWAIDGDEAICPGCGAKGWVSTDGESPLSIDYDETDEHNLVCYEKWIKEHPEDVA